MKVWLVGIVCFIAGLTVVPLGAWAYLDCGRAPVAVADSAFPFEKQLVRAPLHARIEKDLQQSPLQPDDANLLAGANTYKTDCSVCHGLPNHPAAVGRNMYPSGPQLWQKHKNRVVGVSDDPSGETFWRIKNGIRLTGMPSYQKALSDTQMWQGSLLLASAAKPPPAPVQNVLVTP